jgi:uncharacterized protein involved in exopolysaccharide biosynthesis
MSSSTEPAPSQVWENEFHSRFGVAPGSAELTAEREHLVQMCKELLAERDHLRAELARAQESHETYYRAFGALMKKNLAAYKIDKESLMSETAGQPPLQQLLAELGRDTES